MKRKMRIIWKFMEISQSLLHPMAAKKPEEEESASCCKNPLLSSCSLSCVALKNANEPSVSKSVQRSAIFRSKMYFSRGSAWLFLFCSLFSSDRILIFFVRLYPRPGEAKAGERGRKRGAELKIKPRVPSRRNWRSSRRRMYEFLTSFHWISDFNSYGNICRVFDATLAGCDG